MSGISNGIAFIVVLLGIKVIAPDIWNELVAVAIMALEVIRSGLMNVGQLPVS